MQFDGFLLVSSKMLLPYSVWLCNTTGKKGKRERMSMCASVSFNNAERLFALLYMRRSSDKRCKERSCRTHPLCTTLNKQSVEWILLLQIFLYGFKILRPSEASLVSQRVAVIVSGLFFCWIISTPQSSLLLIL